MTSIGLTASLDSLDSIDLFRGDVAVRFADDVAGLGPDDEAGTHDSDLDLATFALLADVFRVIADRVLPP